MRPRVANAKILPVKGDQKWVSPIGTAVSAEIARKVAEDPEYRALHERYAESRQIAWLFIRYRMDHDLTREQLAKRAGTTVGQIARIENGRSKTSLDTLMKIAHALDLKLLIGFEENGGKKRENPELVAV
jgi:DNA-binding XRE family transcriptional regulator